MVGSSWHGKAEVSSFEITVYSCPHWKERQTLTDFAGAL